MRACVVALGDCAEQKRFMGKNTRYTRTYICTNTTICLLLHLKITKFNMISLHNLIGIMT